MIPAVHQHDMRVIVERYLDAGQQDMRSMQAVYHGLLQTILRSPYRNSISSLIRTIAEEDAEVIHVYPMDDPRAFTDALIIAMNYGQNVTSIENDIIKNRFRRNRMRRTITHLYRYIRFAGVCTPSLDDQYETLIHLESEIERILYNATDIDSYIVSQFISGFKRFTETIGGMLKDNPKRRSEMLGVPYYSDLEQYIYIETLDLIIVFDINYIS